MQRPLSALQEKFIKSGFEGFNDREVIKLILSVSCPHMGKDLAEKCLTEFKSLQEFLSASPEQLKQIGLSHAKKPV